MIPIHKLFKSTKFNLDIETKNSNLKGIKVDAIKERKACDTKQTFYNLFEKYGQTHFKAQIYEFQELFQYFADLQKLVRDLSEQIYDDKTKTKIMNMQKEMAPQYLTQSQVSETTEIQQQDNGKNEVEQRYSVIQSLIGKHQMEIDSLSSYYPSIIDSRTQSIAKPIKEICFFCQQSITSNIIQIKCGHNYHSQCLQNLIQSQIHEKKPILYCFCKMKQSIRIVNQLDDQMLSKNLKEQLLILQLKTIEMNNHNLKRCRNKLCYFIYFYNQQLGKEAYCPLCLQMQYVD